ncbi:hypothetical protein C8R43DRAFT_1129074 [Mycena crocata]|nr:hypothetical protein C8R43DRAFT_1129074 [Mycena crocata]
MAPELSAQALAEITNLQNIIAEEQTRQAAAASDTRSSSPDPLSNSSQTRSRDEMESDDFPAIMQPGLQGPYTLEEGRVLKRARNLTPQSDADTPHPMKHTFQMYLAILECRDRLTAICADQNRNYKPSETLGKTCMDWAHAAILSARANSYRDPPSGPSIASNIMTVIDAVKAIIVTGLTQYRCHVKITIYKALDEGEKATDIATLTRTCIGTLHTKPTAILYQRIAFIRSCARECKENNTPDSHFWKEVDKKLSIYHKSATGAEGLQILFKDVYDKDLNRYGQADALIPITQMQHVEDWLTSMAVNPHI